MFSQSLLVSIGMRKLDYTGSVFDDSEVKINKKAVLSQGNRAMPQLFFWSLKFVGDIHYKFKSS